jgi:hypothetical protein
MKKMKLALLASVAVLGLSLAVPVTMAAAPTRDEYKAQVEPICKANAQANERILAGVRKQVKQGKLKAAGAQFSKAAGALKGTLNELRSVPQPTADQPKLAKWLGYVAEEVELFEKVAKKLKTGDKIGAQAMVVRLTHTANLANNQVLPFEFTYCRFDPSKVS